MTSSARFIFSEVNSKGIEGLLTAVSRCTATICEFLDCCDNCLGMKVARDLTAQAKRERELEYIVASIAGMKKMDCKNTKTKAKLEYKKK